MVSPSANRGSDAPASYRADAWRVENAVAGADAIEKLEATPVDDVHERAAKMGHTTFVPATDGGARWASHPQVGPLLRRGFRYLGLQRKRLGRFGRFESHCLVHPDGAAWVTVRAEKWLRLGRSRYFLVSVFDDGSCVETCASPSPIMKPSERHLVRAGTNDVEADLDAHLGALHAHAHQANRPKILPVATHDDMERQHAVYLRHAMSAEVARSMVAVKDNEMIVLRMFATLALGLVLAALLLARAVWSRG